MTLLVDSDWVYTPPYCGFIFRNKLSSLERWKWGQNSLAQMIFALTYLLSNAERRGKILYRHRIVVSYSISANFIFGVLHAQFNILQILRMQHPRYTMLLFFTTPLPLFSPSNPCIRLCSADQVPVECSSNHGAVTFWE